MPNVGETQICATIAASGLFDPQWYLKEYPDVAASGLDPVVHYVRFGEKEGRRPAAEREIWVRQASPTGGSGNLLYDYIYQSKNTDSGTIPIVFACNDKYAPYMSVAIASMISNANPKRDYTIYIFYNSMDIVTRRTILGQETKNIHIEFVWIGNHIDEIICNAHVSGHISIETYFRILIPQLLSQYSKCIYLDSDIVVNADISNLFDKELGDLYIGAAHELWGSQGDMEYALRLHSHPVSFYFNAGVLLININAFKKYNLFGKFIAELEKGVKYPTWDQDILNIITREHSLSLDLSWNMPWLPFVKGSFAHLDVKVFCDYAKSFSHPYIIHYNSELKPWNCNDNYFAIFFWHYARLSPYYQFIKEHSSYATECVCDQFEREYEEISLNKIHINDVDVYGVHEKAEYNIDVMPDSKNHTPTRDGSRVPIVFAINDAFVPYLGVALSSLISNALPHNRYDIFILHNDVSQDSQIKIEELSTSNIRINFINVLEETRDLVAKAHVDSHVSVETYFRIIIPSLFPQYRKIVYLDCDLILNSDIVELYKEDITDFALAGVNDYIFDKDFLKRALETRNKRLFHYINCGVLLINNSYFRDHNLLDDFMEHVSSGVRYVTWDQDILNMICEGKIKRLSPKWNLTWTSVVWKQYTQATPAELKPYMRAFREPAIVHYAGAKKPIDTNDGYFAPLFWKYARKSPYFEELKSVCKYDLDPVLQFLESSE